MRLKLIAGCGCILLPLSLCALDPGKDIFQYNCHTWQREDGLPANGINAISQTSDGFLWLGTQIGLVRFDGLEFKLLKLPNELPFRNQVISSLESSVSNGLWFGIRDGSLGYYNPVSGFSTPQKESWVNDSMNVVSLRETSDGAVWIGTGRGTARWVRGSTNETHMYEQIDYALTIYEDSRHRVWLGTAERGLFCWDHGKLNTFPDPALAKDSVSTLVEDSAGQLWIGTKVGLRCYDAELRPKELLPSHAEVKTLLKDRHGAIWIGTTGEGLHCYKNGTLSTLRKADGLADDTITSLYEDREGSIWVGTRNGLSQISDIKIPLISTQQGLPDRMSHDVCTSADGGVLTATSQGVSEITRNQFRSYSAEQGLSSLYVKRVLQARDGDIYLVNGDKQVEIISGGKVVARHSSSNWPTALAEDSQGVVTSIGNQLFRVGRAQFAPMLYSSGDTPPLYWVRSMFTCRDGSVLVATVNGIFRIKNNTWLRWPKETSLVDTDVLWVYEDVEGGVWTGLRTGLARIKDGNIQKVSQEQGLFDNSIYSFIPDNHGWYWMNSSRGVFKVRKKELNNLLDRKEGHLECVAYDGLESVKTVDLTEVEFGSACKTPDGRIWFANPQGVLMVDPTNLSENPFPPPVHIEQVQANGSELKGEQNPVLRPGKGDLEIHYTASSFIAPQKVQFRYRLEGYEERWVDAGTRRSAFYTNLKPGKYRFQVEACNADGVWSLQGDSVSMDLPPHYYQTAWFQAACGLLGVAALGGIYGWRIRLLRRKEQDLQKANEMLESKVRERTGELLEVSRQAGMAEVATSVLHNVGNVLNSVNVSAGIVEVRIKQSSSANLTKVVRMLEENKDDLPAFLTGSEKGGQLIAYLRVLVEHLDGEKAGILNEIKDLTRNVEHIKEIVAMQQTYARVSGVTEIIKVSDLVEDALRMHALGYERDGVKVIREFSTVPEIVADRHKTIQILVNLMQNARQACENLPPDSRQITVRIQPSLPDHVRIEVADNGVGIPSENLTRIFSHGFTTRKNGHGFGLHGGALAAREMGGSLTVRSDGPGKGATFVLEVPVNSTSVPLASPRSNGVELIKE